MSTQDTIYKKHHAPVEPFAFNSQVASVFTDMAERSIPGYRYQLELLSSFSSVLLRKHEHNQCYDLGCSLGATSACIANSASKAGRQLSITAIDQSSAMIAMLSETLAKNIVLHNIIQPICADIQDYPLRACQLVILNYTLQFINAFGKDSLLKKIYASLQTGGWLLMAEKTTPSTARVDKWHEQFKKHNGYSNLEIAQKRQALEKVMRTETQSAHIARLKKTGFRNICIWFQALNFSAFAAQK